MCPPAAGRCHPGGDHALCAVAVHLLHEAVSLLRRGVLKEGLQTAREVGQAGLVLVVGEQGAQG